MRQVASLNPMDNRMVTTPFTQMYIDLFTYYQYLDTFIFNVPLYIYMITCKLYCALCDILTIQPPCINGACKYRIYRILTVSGLLYPII